MTADDRVDLDAALQLVGAVRAFDRQTVRAVLGRADLPALAVVLAAMVDDDRTATELLGWVDERDDVHDGWPWTDLQAAHAQHYLCRSRGVESPPDVLEGERVYQRVIARRKRARLQDAAA